MDISSTILAVASPPGRSARGIVRISGDQTFDVIGPHLVARSAEHAAEAAGRIIPATFDNLPVSPLPVLVCPFRSPRSFTGQDSCELQMPGNPILLDRVIDALIESGRRRDLDVRRAEPGEFTGRAFFLGKLTLTQAEGVAAIIGARSDAELRAASIMRSGSLGAMAHALADRLAGSLALVEAGIDFTDEEDVVPIAADELRARLCTFRSEIHRELERSVGMEQLEAIPWVVLIGPPNAGKSTLFNALLGRERAVVSAIAGTTRDVLAESLTIETGQGRAELMLVDLAGSDEAQDPLNQQMQKAAAAAVRRAELLLLCIPVDEQLPATVPGDALILRTKADRARTAASPSTGELLVTVRQPHAIDRLRHLLSERLGSRAVSLASDLIALRPRHEAALRSALDHLDAAIRSLGDDTPPRLSAPEITAASMRAALDELGALAGHVTPDDILGRIFGTFCIGK